MLESQIPFVTKVVRRIRFTNDHDVFDADPEVSVFVISGFLCEWVNTISSEGVLFLFAKEFMSHR